MKAAATNKTSGRLKNAAPAPAVAEPPRHRTLPAATPARGRKPAADSLSLQRGKKTAMEAQQELAANAYTEDSIKSLDWREHIRL